MEEGEIEDPADPIGSYLQIPAQRMTVPCPTMVASATQFSCQAVSQSDKNEALWMVQSCVCFRVRACIRVSVSKEGQGINIRAEQSI